METIPSDEVMNAFMRARQKPVTNRCPFKDQEPHNPRRPAALSQIALKHIGHQIDRYGFTPLPYKIQCEYFYRCRECHAVWLGGSPYDQVAESGVLGFYDHAMTWKPHP
jgi:hypothetical protein